MLCSAHGVELLLEHQSIPSIESVARMALACQCRLKIPQFPPIENSPLRRLKFPQVQEDCSHAPAQQAST
jgi:hypothetical protein